MGVEKGLVEILVDPGMVPAYQIYGAVCNSFDSLCVGEDNCFEVRRDQICHSSSQLMVA